MELFDIKINEKYKNNFKLAHLNINSVIILEGTSKT